jgi:hypothetical protein
MTIIAAAFALAVALTPAHTAAEIVVLPAEQRGRDFTMEFDVRFAPGAPRDLDLRLGFAPPGRPVTKAAKTNCSSVALHWDWLLAIGNTSTFPQLVWALRGRARLC